MIVDFSAQLPQQYNRAHRIAYNFTGNHDDAADLVQTSMLKAWRNRGRYPNIENFDAWFNTVVRNTCRDYTRSNRRVPELVKPIETDIVADDPFVGIERQQLITTIQQHLAPSQWQILLMFYTGYSYQEIADHMQTTVATVKTMAYKGRIRARDIAASLV